MTSNSTLTVSDRKTKKRRDQGFKTKLKQVNYQLKQLSKQTTEDQIDLPTVETIRSELQAKKDQLIQKQVLKVKLARERENVDFNPKAKERTIIQIKESQLTRQLERDYELDEEIADLLENLQRKFRFLKQKEESLCKVQNWKR